jgi:HNH endonuclease
MRPSTIERFCAGVVIDPSNECWIWVRHRTRGGYAELRNDGRTMLAHRFAYHYFREPVPPGLTLDHLCRNRHCVNPWHLEAVTLGENTKRSPIALTAVNSRKMFCKRGHEFTEENTYHSLKGRECRMCKRLLRLRHWRRTGK